MPVNNVIIFLFHKEDITLKYLKIIFFNFILLTILFFIADFSFYAYMYKRDFNLNMMQALRTYGNSFQIRYFDDLYEGYKKTDYFPDRIFKNTKHNKKRPLLIFGCSFGYGWLLKKEQSFSYKLAELTGRDVYNRSVAGLGLQYFPYILETTDIEKEINNPEYIIFVFIENHVDRLFRFYNDETNPNPDIQYKRTKDGKSLQINKNPLWYSGGAAYFAICRNLMNTGSRRWISTRPFDEKFDYIKEYFIYAKQIANKKFPNSKLVILQYEENNNSPFNDSPRWKELEQEGYIVLNSLELTQKHLSEQEYKTYDKIHPNEQAWDILTPKVAEKLKL